MVRNLRWLATIGMAMTTLAAAAQVDETDDNPVRTPLQQALVDAVEHDSTTLNESTDLALRAIYSVGGLEEHPDHTFHQHENVPIATLVDLARGSTDPLLLDVLVARCGKRTRCDRVDLAARWTLADTENQVAWLTLASVRADASDRSGARVAFLRAAQASVWHGHYGDALRRADRALPADLAAPLRATTLRMIFARSALALPFPALRALSAFCKEDADDVRAACATIVRTIERDADELLSLRMAEFAAVSARMDAQAVERDRQKVDALRWATAETAPLGAEAWDPSDPTETSSLRAAIQQLERRIAMGERPYLEAFLREAHVSDADAAKRYEASRPQGQSDVMRGRSALH